MVIYVFFRVREKNERDKKGKFWLAETGENPLK